MSSEASWPEVSTFICTCSYSVIVHMSTQGCNLIADAYILPAAVMLKVIYLEPYTNKYEGNT